MTTEIIERAEILPPAVARTPRPLVRMTDIPPPSNVRRIERARKVTGYLGAQPLLLRLIEIGVTPFEPRTVERYKQKQITKARRTLPRLLGSGPLHDALARIDRRLRK